MLRTMGNIHWGKIILQAQGWRGEGCSDIFIHTSAHFIGFKFMNQVQYFWGVL